MAKKTFNMESWKPEAFGTKKEIEDFFEKHNISKKKIKKINTIGMAANMEESECVQMLIDALGSIGISGEDIESGRIEGLDHVFVPGSVFLCEPVVFVFEDRTTLEMMPFEGRTLLMSVNQITPGTTDGGNHCNYDPGILFAGAAGCFIRGVSVWREQFSSVDGYPDREEEDVSYVRFQLYLEGGDDNTGLFFRQSRQRNFEFGLLRLEDFEDWGANKTAGIPFSTVNAARRNKRQVILYEGTFREEVLTISPARPVVDEENKTVGLDEDDDREVSIAEEDVDVFLRYFLEKHFDRKFSYGELRNSGSKGYDELFPNVYSYAAMEKMLADIDRMNALLQNDYGNWHLNLLKRNFDYMAFLPAGADADRLHTAKAAEQIIRKNISVATDFYARFTARMRKMMKEAPEYGYICFMML